MPSMQSRTAPALSSSSPAPASTAARADAAGGGGFGVYVHWPFCASKCPYCDFNSHVRAGGIDEDRFLRAYLCELRHWAELAPARSCRQHFLRWRYAIADVRRHRCRHSRRHCAALEHGCRHGNHAGSQSFERGGGAGSAIIAPPASTGCRSACNPSRRPICGHWAGCTRSRKHWPRSMFHAKPFSVRPST